MTSTCRHNSGCIRITCLPVNRVKQAASGNDDYVTRRSSSHFGDKYIPSCVRTPDEWSSSSSLAMPLLTLDHRRKLWDQYPFPLVFSERALSASYRSGTVGRREEQRGITGDRSALSLISSPLLYSFQRGIEMVYEGNSQRSHYQNPDTRLPELNFQDSRTPKHFYLRQIMPHCKPSYRSFHYSAVGCDSPGSESCHRPSRHSQATQRYLPVKARLANR